MSESGPPDAGRRRTAASALLVVALLEAVVTVVAAAASDLSWTRLTELFVPSNAAIGLCLALAGWPIAYHRPRNLVGWTLLLGGCCYASTATGLSVLAWLGEPTVPWRIVATVTNGGWSPALAFFIPLTLLLFPDGQLLSRRWRWVVAALVLNAVLWTATGVFDQAGGLSAEIGIPGYPHWTGFEQIQVIGAISSAGLLASLLAALLAVVLRYRRSSEQVRRQVLWLLLALLVIVACFGLENLIGTESLVLGVLPLLLIPLAIAIAVLRHQLLDIRLVVSRSLLYLILAGGVVVAYLSLIALLDRNSSVLVTLVIALAFNPVRVWLQRVIHRAFYGARRDPVRAIAEVGAQIGAAGGLVGVLAALCRVMRFPAASIVVEGNQMAAYGELPAARHAIELWSGEERLGELVVGLRTGESRVNAGDEQVLSLLAAPLAVAVQAKGLADELRDSRERIITGREEERRRIRRDLHDGLGPVLTAVVLNADAARRLMETEPERTSALLAELRDQAIGAVEEIRRLVYDLRPPALDGLGLVGALSEYAAMASRRGDGAALTVTVDGPATLAELPAAVEVAAYRIATEALTNVIRHSTATTAAIRVAVETDVLRVGVLDNGVNAEPEWTAGVGLGSMRERAAELGGRCEITFNGTGCSVDAVLPLTEGARR
ncbi:histidine kinase [Kribbella sp. NPDC056861]|uniref:sensor histidine kinase n=1 Tax=Kribbella sp. NPDC056861 TaxID=3154857 RepID=UPI00343CDF1C